MLSDNEIIIRVLDGDYDAFETLVEKYQGRIYRHLRKMVRDQSEAQDLLQETFLSAYKGLKGFAGNSSFSTWLFKIASNAALMFLRRQRPEMLQYDEQIRDSEGAEFVPASPEFVSTPLDILLSAEGRRKIEEAIDGLPLIYRTVIILRDVEGFSLEEVAGIIESSVPAVKSRLHRGRHSIREALSSYYGEVRSGGKRRALQES
ncbi:MAG: sigma-70 family RNA polymerase sigma factor [Deltaproteobacteria bacterium]|jgi:RNA polymerase sigma-70 factor (ECF subfamily)|nr:sigma-70 family RNA polymerase sigma factor [Deltaproteobacteria bacterium]